MRAIVIILVFTAGYWVHGVQPSWAQDNSAQNFQQISNSANFTNNDDPNIGVDQWRLIPYIGWRKFAPVDAFYYDWLNFRKTTRNRYYIW